MKYPILKQTEHAFSLKALDQAYALHDLHRLPAASGDGDRRTGFDQLTKEE
jgi:hypothetical protein